MRSRAWLLRDPFSVNTKPQRNRGPFPNSPALLTTVLFCRHLPRGPYLPTDAFICCWFLPPKASMGVLLGCGKRQAPSLHFASSGKVQARNSSLRKPSLIGAHTTGAPFMTFSGNVICLTGAVWVIGYFVGGPEPFYRWPSWAFLPNLVTEIAAALCLIGAVLVLWLRMRANEEAE